MIPRPPTRITAAFGFAYVERPLLEAIGRRRFLGRDAGEVANYFGTPLTCVYCGSPEVKRWDHLVPVVTGGESIVGNMVPACGSCDDSKAAGDFAEWLRRRAAAGVVPPAFAESQISRLSSYMQHCGYEPRKPELTLPPEDQAELARLRARLLELRRDVQVFVARVKVRD